MNTPTLSPTTLGNSSGRSDSQDSGLNTNGTQVSKILNHMKSEIHIKEQNEKIEKELHLKRIQSLRKELEYLKSTEWSEYYRSLINMLSLIINTAKYIFGQTQKKELKYEEILKKYPALIEDPNDSDNSSEINEQSNEGCFYRDGIVTSIGTDNVIIDDRYVCDLINCPDNIEKGNKVYYLAFKKKTQKDITISRIISIINDIWDQNCEENNVKKSQMIKKSIVAKVIKRKGRNVMLEPANIFLDLDKIQSTFVPYVGDWLVLESLVELDPNSGDLGGEILEVNRIQPLRSKLKIGIIAKYDSQTKTGSVEKNVVFNKASCQSGYIPHIGDKVVYDCIESDQGIYSWRCLSVVPLIQTADDEETLTTGSFPNITPKKLNLLLTNKFDVSITDDLFFNLILNQEGTLEVIVKNNGAVDQTLVKGVFISKKSQSQLSVESHNVDDPMTFKPGESIVYVFKCSAKFMGLTEELFIFNFKNFTIGRIFKIFVGLKNSITTTSITNGNYDPNKLARQDNHDQGSYIPGIRPYRPPNFIAVRNGIFKVPQRFWNIVLPCINEKLSQATTEAVVGNEFQFLHDGLTFENYKNRFHALLYLEEISMTVDLQKYDMDSAIMYPSDEYLVLKVPGLAERRPSLICGDRAIVKFKWDSSQGKLKYEGFIHKIKSSEVYLKFNPKFHDTYKNEDCQISFKCSFSTLSRCHNAVNLAISNLGSEILFPTLVKEKEPQIDLKEYDLGEINLKKTSSNLKSPENSDEPTDLLSKIERRVKEQIKSGKNMENLDSYNAQIKKRKLFWYNKRLNFYQKEAVKNILRGVSRPLPYIIFGPPGTGKTITLCETILQILTIIPESRLLIATPSNSSANLIAERLLDSKVLKPGDLVRLVARHCLDDDSIPEKLLPYCATGNLAAERSTKVPEYSGEGCRINCTMSVLGRHRITVGTCIALGLLYNMGFPKGHFTHIIVDEAGQATEPEIMVPLTFIHANYGQIILAGDPMQLGPVVNSRLANYFGLSESFLARLLQQFPYQRDTEGFETGYDPRLVTKLLINYRSLPEILELPNSMFYESELQATVNPLTSSEAELLKSISAELPSRECLPPSLVFHGIVGSDCQDNDSPSWYNPTEAAQVYSYLVKLYSYGLTEEDIGVITPYKKQVAYIRTLLWDLDMLLPKIGSVEEFQGQERKIIIISTVRSNSTYVDNDIKHALGFVTSPKRLNVALTRARALIIILGNPYLLSQDPYWRNVLVYCISNHSYTGCNFSFANQNDDNDESDIKTE